MEVVEAQPHQGLCLSQLAFNCHPVPGHKFLVYQVVDFTDLLLRNIVEIGCRKAVMAGSFLAKRNYAFSPRLLVKPMFHKS